MSAQAAPKRAGKDKGKGGGAQRYKSKRTVGGRGIFVTCIRGKEQRSQAEFMDLLDEVSPTLLQLTPSSAHLVVFASLLFTSRLPTESTPPTV
jgi:hypothetical protein